MKRPQFSAVAFMALTIIGGTIVALAQGMDQPASMDGQLLQAADDRDIGSVQRLLKRGANIEARDQQGSTALIGAAESGNTAMVKFLLENGTDAAASDNNHETALIQAARVAALLGVNAARKPPGEKNSHYSYNQLNSGRPSNLSSHRSPGFSNMALSLLTARTQAFGRSRL